MLNIYIDADGCAVKDETYKVSERHQLKVFVVANQWLKIPLSPKIEMSVVSGGFDAADDWIVEQVTLGDIVITSDILLADRALKKQARVLGAKGEEFTEDNIGNALAGRELATHLRQIGESKGGPSSMTKTDRSKFLSQLEQIIQSVKRTTR